MTIQIVGNGEVGIMADISIKELIEEMVQSDPHKIILSGMDADDDRQMRYADEDELADAGYGEVDDEEVDASFDSADEEDEY